LIVVPVSAVHYALRLVAIGIWVKWLLVNDVVIGKRDRSGRRLIEVFDTLPAKKLSPFVTV
jgi:hypothetical protein